MRPKEMVWRIMPFLRDKAEALSRESGFHPLVCQIFINRGINTPESIKEFLHPKLKNLYDPFRLKDMPQAVERIGHAICNNEKILIFGDFDVDGITASGILNEFLECQGADVMTRLPHRVKEGYGLTKNVVNEAKRHGVKLIITVDCGISDNNAAQVAKRLGIDLIITDHHHPPEELPEALAIINPHQPGCSYPFKELAGVGVAFKLIQALALDRHKGGNDSCGEGGFWPPEISDYLDLVCLGTIADVVPLYGENRILVKFGLEALERSQRPGIIALKEISGIKENAISVGSVGFALAPRINATGRIYGPEDGLRLLLTKSREEAKSLADLLNQQNQKRKQIEEKILKTAMEKIKEDKRFYEKTIIVLSDRDWHPGVIGIVAQRLVEEFYLPTILISVESGIGRGSARSIPQVHLYELLNQCKDMLMDFGGHAAAAGLTIEEKKIEEFSHQTNQIVRDRLFLKDFVKELTIDAEVNQWIIDYDLIEQLNSLYPFGFGNPEPVLCLKGIYMASNPQLLKDSHLKVNLKHEAFIHEAIGFNMRSIWEDMSASPFTKNWDVAFYPQINNWLGRRKIQLRLKDVRAHDPY